jgi:hypothetical protein
MSATIEKTSHRFDPAVPIRLYTAPRARAVMGPRAGPWITGTPLTGAQY